MPQKKFTKGAVEQWTVEDVGKWLVTAKLDGCRDYYFAEGINGVRLLQLTNDDIKEMPCNLGNEKRRKVMKKALSSLPGNSVAKQAPPKQGRKFGLAGGKSRGKAPSPPPSPPSHLSQAHQLPRRPNFAPPPPGMGGVDTYQDPNVTFGVGGGGGGGGVGGMDDIYDRVDDLQFEGNGFAPPPPAGYPPQEGGFTAPNIGAPPPPEYPPQEEDGYAEELYEEGLDLEGDEFDDSFSSEEDEEPDEDYESPFEEDPNFRQKEGSDAHRALEAKFWVAGLKQHSTIKVQGSQSIDYRGEEEEENGPDEIYDTPPQANEDEGEGDIMEDIYDLPPEELLGHTAVDAMVGHSGKAPAPPPPMAPPPDDDEEGEDGLLTDEVYDIPSEVLEEAMGGGKAPPPPPPVAPPPIEEDDIYDTADLEEPGLPQISSFPARPPKFSEQPMAEAPSLPSRPWHSKATPAGTSGGGGGGFVRPNLKKPIGSRLQGVSPPPPDTEPPPPPRPPKVAGGGRTPPPRPRTPDSVEPLSQHQQQQQQPFQRVQLRPPIKNPEASSGNSGGAPPPRPSANLKPPLPSSTPPTASGGDGGGPWGKSPAKDDKVESKFGKRSPTASPQFGLRPTDSAPRSTGSSSPTPPVSHSPKTGRKFPAKPSEMKSSNFNTQPSASHEARPKFGAPHVPPQSGGGASKFTKAAPPTSSNNTTSNGLAGKPNNDSRNKPKLPTAPKVNRIKDLMNRFESSKQAENEDSTGSDDASNPSPAHRVSALAAPEKPSGDVSPLSGRRMERKDSVGNLRTKFEQKKPERTVSPARDSRGSPSPDVPILPPKPGGVAAAWQRKPVPPIGGGGGSGPQLARSKPAAAQEEPPPVVKSAKPWQQKQQQRDSPAIVEEPPPPSRFGRKPVEEPPLIDRGSKPPWQQQQQQQQQQQREPSPIEEEPPPPLRFSKPKEELKPSSSPHFERKSGKGPPPPPQVSSPRFGRKREEPTSPSPPFGKRSEPNHPAPGRKIEEPHPPSPPSFGRREGGRAPSPQMIRKGREEQSSPPFNRKTAAEPITPDGDKRAFTYRPYSRRQSDAGSQHSIEEEPPPPSRLPPKPGAGPAEPHQPPMLSRPPLPKSSMSSRLPPVKFPPPSEPAPPDPPRLPSRPPPQNRPSAQVSEQPMTEAPSLPSRPWHSKPPDVRREPDHPPPLPPSSSSSSSSSSQPEEPVLPARPPKPGGGPGAAGSPRGKSWYHYSLDRKKAEAKLKRYAKNGTFIVRDSTRVQGEYSLSLWYSDGIRHLRIRLREDKKFVLGEAKEDEVAFDAVHELIEYHKTEPLHLKSGGETTLRYECPQ